MRCHFSSFLKKVICYTIFYFQISREVVLGEWKTSSNPDCQQDVCAPEKITRKVAKRIIHENYTATNEDDEDVNGQTQRNDIVLLRLDEAVPLNSDDPSKSLASPVCLPW